MQPNYFPSLLHVCRLTFMWYIAWFTLPKIIAGGQFGPEGAIQALLFCLVATVVIIPLLKNQNKILKP
jgi:hypothetical protein